MKTGILLINLGTPRSCSPQDVKNYLLEFLLDPRVVDLPTVKRNVLVRGLIVPKRYKESAKTYAEIWTEDGSPLLVYGEALKEALQGVMGEEFLVELAMRYQEPSIEKGLNRLQKAGVDHLVICPLFPQYASATTGSVHQRVMEIVKDWQVIPRMSLISSYPDHPALIDAHREIAWGYNPHSFDHILFSFHGLPENQLKKANPSGRCLEDQSCCDTLRAENKYCYRANCMRTAKALVKALDIPEKKYSICFQSRLGKTPWLQPYTSDKVKQLGEQGHERVLVFSPSFVCDCIETTHEIGIELQEEFQEAGGGELTLVQGLNTHPTWVKGLKEIILDYCSHPSEAADLVEVP